MSEHSIELHDGGGAAPRWFAPGLLALLVLGAALRLLMLEEFLRIHPAAWHPWTDGGLYWAWAGRLAGGTWIGDNPFFSAPLYPYFLGVLRAAGVGLPGIYILQIVLHLVTAIVIALATRLRFGAGAGLLAAALFLLLTDPAVSVMRVLACTLQLLLVALLWWRWAVLSERRDFRWRNIVVTGSLCGLLSLAWPPAIVLIPSLALSIAWTAGWTRNGLMRAAVAVAAGMLFVLTATLHNVRSSGEVILLTAHSGITLAHGNGPDARGVYTYRPGISERRERQNESAQSLFRASSGREGTWKEVDSFLRGQTVTWWRAHPGAAAILFARKAYYFVSGVHYDEMMPVALEREYGIARRSWLSPLPLPWLLGAAVLALAALGLRSGRFLPEWILLALPLLVIVAFYYSPRYRLPVVPVVCGLAAAALVNWRRLRVPRALAAVICVLPIVATLVNPVVGFDRPDDIRAPYARLLSGALMRQGHRDLTAGNLEEAEGRLKEALEVEPTNRIARRLLGETLLERGNPEEAVATLRRAAEDYRREPFDPRGQALTYRLLGNGLATTGRLGAAADSWAASLDLEGDHAATRLALAWLLATAEEDGVRNGQVALAHAEAARLLAHAVDAEMLDVLAAAAAEAGRFEEAVAAAHQALAVVDPTADGGLAAAIARRLAMYERRTAAREAPRLVPVRP